MTDVELSGRTALFYPFPVRKYVNSINCQKFFHMDDISLLARLGVADKPARAYLALLAAGDASVAELARRAGLHRADCYKALPVLKDLKLAVTLNRGKRTLWRAAPPVALDALRRDFDANFSGALERLTAKHESVGLRAELTHAKGARAVGEIYIEAARLTPVGESYLRFNARRDPGLLPHPFIPEYRKVRKERRTGRTVIMSEKMKSFWGPKGEDPTREVVTVPKGFDAFDDNISKFIYADRVSVVDHDLQETFTIRSHRFARFEAKVFRLLFKLLREREGKR